MTEYRKVLAGIRIKVLELVMKWLLSGVLGAEGGSCVLMGATSSRVFDHLVSIVG